MFHSYLKKIKYSVIKRNRGKNVSRLQLLLTILLKPLPSLGINELSEFSSGQLALALL